MHGFSALRFARRVGDERCADVLATLGVVLCYAGRSGEAIRRLEEAVPLTPAVRLPYLLVRRANVFHVLARYDEALADLSQAVSGLHALGDTLWEGRALNNRSQTQLARGDTEAAAADAMRAELLLTSLGEQFEATEALHNRALAALHRDDLPDALTLIDEAMERYVALGNVRYGVVIVDRVQILLTAGLIDEAVDLCESTLSHHDLAPILRAELLLTKAHALFGRGELAAAEVCADEASRLFASQRRAGWLDRARLLRLQARYHSAHPETPGRLAWTPGEVTEPGRGAGRDGGNLLVDATAVVDGLRTHHAQELPVALLLHGRIAHDEGCGEESERSLAAAAATRHEGPPLSRSAGWLASALLARQRHDRRALYAACRHGLNAVDEHRGILGDMELRALASGHGLELAQLAVAEAVRSGQPRQIMWWTERWRAAALDGSVDRPSDPALAQELAALRDVARRLETADKSAPGAPALGRERDRLESSIRQRYRHLRSEGAGPGGAPAAHGPDLPALLAELAGLDDLEGRDEGGILLYLVNDRDTLHLLTATGGRVVHSHAGPLAVALREAEFARFALRRAAHGRQVDLARQGRLLQDALLGERLPAALRRLADDGTGRPRHVVIVPPAHLLTAPWGLLPLVRNAVVTVAPSTTQWLRARRLRSSATDTGRAGHVALVTGPGLTSREAEVSTLHTLHQGARVLSSDRATVAAAVEVLDGAALGHVAAHGHFRADAPLFSTLTLADGPLT
ncbi:MAG TPA: CHAT domain-containing protein, partial [Humibacillus xanthopallidus]|nr:CHAT domain-containing protein [Humibacillus xanthopallidus]